MRLPLVSPSDLSPEQQNLSQDMRQGIETNFKGFQAINRDGALIGPWNPWLRFSKLGGPVWELVKALSTSPSLPRPVREVAILVTGAHFHSAYEFYAHVLIAEARYRNRSGPSGAGIAMLMLALADPSPIQILSTPTRRPSS